MDYGFTAKIEEEFDEIANGKKKWNNMLHDFYDPFHQDVEETLEKAERVKGERLLGQDPATGKPVGARMGVFGTDGADRDRGRRGETALRQA